MFGWFEVSGKVLYTFKSEGKSTPLPTSGEVSVRELTEGKGFSLSLPKNKSGTPGKILYLNEAGEELNLNSLNTPNVKNKTELLQFSNVWFISVMKDLNFNHLGGFTGRYFDTTKPMGTAFGQLDIYSGYKISPEIYTGSKTKLLLDRQTRVVSRTTLLNEWDPKGNTKSQLDKFIGKNFVHIPTNKNIRISGFAMKMTPQSEYETGEFANYAEMYKKAYGVTEKIKKQFLVYSSKKLKIKDDQGEFIKERTYYLPQFLRTTGMSDYQKNDHKMM